MSKRNRRQPSSPEEAHRKALERRGREAEIARLTAQGDVKVIADPAKRIQSAFRIDVFALLHSRGTLTDHQLGSVRELEQLLASATGANRPEANFDRVDGSANTGAPGQNITQHMVDADRIACAVMREVGPINAKILKAMLVEGGAVLSRWRDTVHTITRETNERAQAAVVRSVCQNLHLVMTERGYLPKAA